jgi:hypothetical protein
MMFPDNLQFIRNARIRTKTRKIQTNLFCNICIYQAKMGNLLFEIFFFFLLKQFISYCVSTRGSLLISTLNSSHRGVVEELFKNVETDIQGVTEISALILTGNGTRLGEQLFSLPFWRGTLRNGLEK